MDERARFSFARLLGQREARRADERVRRSRVEAQPNAPLALPVDFSSVRMELLQSIGSVQILIVIVYIVVGGRRAVVRGGKGVRALGGGRARAWRAGSEGREEVFVALLHLEVGGRGRERIASLHGVSLLDVS